MCLLVYKEAAHPTCGWLSLSLLRLPPGGSCQDLQLGQLGIFPLNSNKLSLNFLPSLFLILLSMRLRTSKTEPQVTQ